MDVYFASSVRGCLLAVRAWLALSSRLLLLLIAAGSVCVALSQPAGAHPIIGHTEDLTPVEFNLGNYKFRIPRAYLLLKPHWYGQSLDGGPETKGVLLVATINDMRPYTKDRHDLFEGPDLAPRTVHLDISATTYDRLRGEGFLWPEVWSKCEKIVDLNYFRCGPRAAEPHFDPWQEIFILKAENESYVVACRSDSTKNKYAKYSLCDSHIRFRPYLFLEVTFERSHLGDAPRIISRIRSLVESFYVGHRETPTRDRSKP